MQDPREDRRLVEFFARYLERDGEPGGQSTLAFATLGTGAWQAVTRWPLAGAGTRRWHLGPMAGLTLEASPAASVTYRADVTASTGATNRVPRTFARSDALDVVPGNLMRLTVLLLPVSAVVPAGHRVRVAIAGHDASCFTRYGPAEETFTLRLGSDSHLDLPVRYG